MASKRKRGDSEGKKKATYKTISGVKYDRGMLDTVEAATDDKDRLDIADCKKLFVEIIDGNKYTDIEKTTMKYIREHYKFETDADQWIRKAIASWAAKKAVKDAAKESKEEKLYCKCNEPESGTMVGCDAQLSGCYNWYHMACTGLTKDTLPDVWFCESCTKKKAPARGSKDKPKKESYYKQINNKKYDKGMLEAADTAVEGKGDGRVSIDDAKKIFKEAVDGDKITECEYDTLDYIKANYKWTEKSTEWLNNALTKWEVDHPRKKVRAARAKKEKKDEGEKETKKKSKKKGPAKKKAKKDEKEEEEKEEKTEDKKDAKEEEKKDGATASN